MIIRRACSEDTGQIVGLITAFRAALAELRQKTTPPDCEAAARESSEYQKRGFPIFVAQEGSSLVGYLVCRVDGKTVWAESLFVLPEFRRKGIASALYAEAERLAEDLGSDTVYNWIHPNNDEIVSFLKKRGYCVLNLVEVRRPRPAEKITGKISIDRHEFDY